MQESTIPELQQEIARLQRRVDELEQHTADIEISLETTTELADFFENQLLQRAVELEQRNLELDAFAHTVAHDLKSPLSGILSMVEILLYLVSADKPFGPDNINRMHLLEKSAQEMMHIIQDLLLLAGVTGQHQSGIEIHPLDMQQIVQRVLQDRLRNMMDDYHPIVEAAPEWPAAKGYGPWIVGVWTNYISNALKYGGKPPILRLGGETMADGMIRFWVKDNGNGISLEQQASLFKPFSRIGRPRVDGHGLGLSIVQQIVAKLGGRVGVESSPGQGSRFYFILPAA